MNVSFQMIMCSKVLNGNQAFGKSTATDMSPYIQFTRGATVFFSACFVSNILVQGTSCVGSFGPFVVVDMSAVTDCKDGSEADCLDQSC